MLRLLASRGVVVLSPVRVGALSGVGPNAPIVGGLLPGAQATEEVTEQHVYPRLQHFILHALMQVARRSEIGGDPSSGSDGGDSGSLPARLRRRIDGRNVAIVGFSAGAALAVYAAEESQTVWPGRVRAVVRIIFG